MRKSVRSKAEEHFIASERKDQQDLKDKEKARRERAEHMAKLRGLRMAKEAADKEAAETAAANDPTAKNKPPTRLPQAHRHIG